MCHRHHQCLSSFVSKQHTVQQYVKCAVLCWCCKENSQTMNGEENTRTHHTFGVMMRPRDFPNRVDATQVISKLFCLMMARKTQSSHFIYFMPLGRCTWLCFCCVNFLALKMAFMLNSCWTLKDLGRSLNLNVNSPHEDADFFCAWSVSWQKFLM